MRRSLGGLAAIVLVVAVVGCGGDDSSSSTSNGSPDTSVSGEPLRVVANFYPLAEAVGRVGGDLVQVENLTPPGAEPHDLELTTDDVDAIEDADLVVYLGSGFQPGVEEAAGRRDGPTLDVGTAVPLEEGDIEAIEAQEAAEEGTEGGAEGETNADEATGNEAAGDEAPPADEGDDDHHEEIDPHFWLDPTLLRSAVDAIESELATVAPDQAATFAANADAYRAELDGLDADMTAGLQGCARTQIVTTHAAFYYLARRYGLEQLPITGLSPEAEPDPARLDELADLIERDGITTVFYETLVSPDIADTLARETGVATAVLNPIEGLTDDEMAAGADYVSVQEQNLAALRAALACSGG